MSKAKKFVPKSKTRFDTLSGEASKILYTEDHIPVNTIYVSLKQGRVVDEAYIKSKFQKFGIIKQIVLVSRDAIQFAFVHFEKCEDAAKAFHNRNTIDGCRINQADSWHQAAFPDKIKGAKLPTGTTEQEDDLQDEAAAAPETSSKVFVPEISRDNILILNDDCLMHILSFLDMLELIKIKNVCSRIENIIRQMYKRYKVFDFDTDVKKILCVTLMEAREILGDVGMYVQKLTMNSARFTTSNMRLINLIPRTCTSLKELYLEGFVLNGKLNKGFEDVFKNLETLVLKNCGVNDTLETLLKLGKNLKRLNLSSNSEITGKCLKVLKNIEYLNIENCPNIQSKHFSAFCAKNKELKFLNITRCNNINLDALKSICENLQNLEHMVINSSYVTLENRKMIILAELPKLKRIQIMFTNFSSIDPLLAALAEKDLLEHLDISNGIFTPLNFTVLYKFSKLKELNLNYKLDIVDEHLLKIAKKGHFTEMHLAGCPSISDEALLEFMKLNNRLKVLDVSYSQISEKLIFGAIDILKEQNTGKEHRHLKLIIGQTHIEEVILKNALISNNRDLLEISFECTHGPYDLNDDGDYEDDDDGDPDDYDLDNDVWNSDYDPDYDDYHNRFWYYSGSSDDSWGLFGDDENHESSSELVDEEENEPDVANFSLDSYGDVVSVNNSDADELPMHANYETDTSASSSGCFEENSNDSMDLNSTHSSHLFKYSGTTESLASRNDSNHGSEISVDHESANDSPDLNSSSTHSSHMYNENENGESADEVNNSSYASEMSVDDNSAGSFDDYCDDYDYDS